MTPQATNCLELFRGANPSTIKRALSMQKTSIVNELKDYVGTSSIDELCLHLSLGTKKN